MEKSLIKTILLTLVGFLASAGMYANDRLSDSDSDFISVNTACANALDFLNAHKAAGQQSRRKAPLRQADLTLCAQRPNMYVFNVGTSEGFIVASASSTARPVLCYSTDGQWDEALMQQTLGWLFEQYDAEISSAKQVRTRAASAMTSISKSPIEPLIKTLWHQDAPYNDKLTAFTWQGTTYHVKTGCVATAMAQIMKYHQWPKTISKEIPAYNHGQLIGDNATEVAVKAVPAGTVIDWEHTDEAYLWDDTDPAIKDAVSNLMMYCGTAVRMYYAEFVSSSHNLTAMYALKHYFDYDPAMYMASREAYTYYDWCNLLYNELRAGRPLLYNGQGNGGGHSFIIDGYDGNEMFHFNLGWNQKSSIYAVLSSMGHDTAVDNPDAYDSPDGYVYHQSAVINVQKAALSQGVYHVSLNCDVSFQGEGITVSYYNNEDEPYTFDLGLGYRDADGNLHAAKAIDGVSMAAASAYSQHYSASELSLPKGEYHVVPIARLNGGLSEWEVVGNELDYHLAKADAQGNVTLAEHKRLAVLSAADITFSGSPYVDQELYVFCNIKNSGEEDYFNKLYFFWNDNPANKGIDAGHYLLWSHATVNAGGTAPVEFYFTPDRAGEYTVWITTDAQGEDVVGQATVSIGAQMPYEITSEAPVRISNLKLANFQDGAILGNDVVADFDITNTSTDKYFHGLVEMGVIRYSLGGEYYLDEKYPEGLTHVYDIAPGETRHFQFSVTDLKSDCEVAIKLHAGSWDVAYTSDHYPLLSAAILYTPGGVKTSLKAAASITIPETVAAVDLTNVAGTVTTVVPNSNPNTIYYVKAGATVPQGLSGCNVVVGNQAQSIVLDAAYGVAVPKSFYASSTKCTLQLQKGTWSTLCMPFSSQLTNSQVEIAAVTDEGADHITINPAKWFEAYQTCFVRGTVDGPQTLTATNVMFPQQGNAISVLNNYKAQGVMGATTVQDVYILSSNTTLTHMRSAQMKPFTSFFIPTKRGHAPSSDIQLVYDASHEVESGLHATPEAAANAPRYNLAGQRVGQDYRGIVVEKGRKMLVK